MTPSVPIAARRVPRTRGTQRRGGVAVVAVVASLSAHALCATLIGVALYGLPRTRDQPAAAGVEVEVVAEPAPLIAALSPAPAPPVFPPRALPRTSAARAPTPRPNRTLAAPEVPPSSLPLPSTSPAAETPPTEESPPVLFAMSAGTVAWRSPAVAAPASPSPAAGVAGGGAPPRDGTLDAAAVDVPARLIASRPAVYPPRARAAGVETDVALEILVGTDGRVIDARVVSPRGYGLDAAATEAVRDFRFSPASRAGRPVRVRMPWTVQFRLH